jgi:hypothetical protein
MLPTPSEQRRPHLGVLRLPLFAPDIGSAHDVSSENFSAFATTSASRGAAVTGGELLADVASKLERDIRGA